MVEKLGRMRLSQAQSLVTEETDPIVGADPLIQLPTLIPKLPLFVPPYRDLIFSGCLSAFFWNRHSETEILHRDLDADFHHDGIQMNKSLCAAIEVTFLNCFPFLISNRRSVKREIQKQKNPNFTQLLVTLIVGKILAFKSRCPQVLEITEWQPIQCILIRLNNNKTNKNKPT